MYGNRGRGRGRGRGGGGGRTRRFQGNVRTRPNVCKKGPFWYPLGNFEIVNRNEIKKRCEDGESVRIAVQQWRQSGLFEPWIDGKRPQELRGSRLCPFPRGTEFQIHDDGSISQVCHSDQEARGLVAQWKSEGVEQAWAEGLTIRAVCR